MTIPNLYDLHRNPDLRPGFEWNIASGIVIEIIPVGEKISQIAIGPKTGKTVGTRSYEVTITNTTLRPVAVTLTDRAGSTISRDYHASEGLVYSEDFQNINRISVTLDMSSPAEPSGVTITYTIAEDLVGIFSIISALTSPEWDADGMDEEFVELFARSKIPTQELFDLADLYGPEDPEKRIHVLDERGLTYLARVINARFGQSWENEYNAIVAEYEPLENYSMTETDTPDLRTTHSVSDDYSETDETKTNFKTTSDASAYGFNSSSPVPVSKNVGTGGETDNHGTTEHTMTGSTFDSQTGSRTLTRSGNIGVTTSQQMLQSELDLRIRYRMRDIMYRDAESVMTTPGFSRGITRRK